MHPRRDWIPLWQWHHDFVSLEFLRSIHAQDVRIGRTDGFLLQQLFIGANPFAIPLWLADVLWRIRTKPPNPDKPEPKRYKVGRSQNLRKPNNHEGSLRQAAKLSVLKHSIYLVRY